MAGNNRAILDDSEVLNEFIRLVLKNFSNIKDENASHLNVECDSCLISDFSIYRYKCLICDDYDLCGSCFEKRQVTKDHKLEHALVRFDQPDVLFGVSYDEDKTNLIKLARIYKNEEHKNIYCNVCKAQPILGLRFKCDTCFNYDMCYDCYINKRESNKHSFEEHPLVVECNSSLLKIETSNIQLLEKLGSGAFGTVHKARLRDINKIVACKIIDLEEKKYDSYFDKETLIKSYKQELKSYKELKGVNIIKMFGYCRSGLKFILVTEFMEKGSLASLLKNEQDISYRRRLQMMVGVASGMARIHERNFIHRDIRPDNILVSKDYTAKIADFGIAKFFKNSMDNSMIGPINYMPPEFYTGNYDKKLDVYTFGLTMVEVFDGEHSKKGLHSVKILREPVVFRKLIYKCLSINPIERPESKKLFNYLTVNEIVCNQFLIKKVPGYITMSSETKNNLFRKINEKMEQKF